MLTSALPRAVARSAPHNKTQMRFLNLHEYQARCEARATKMWD